MMNLYSKNVAIIVPVYGDWESLKKNIKALKKSISLVSKHTVLFVNDCGPEADEIEKKILKLIKYRKNFAYYRNDRNMGFVKSCNNAVLNLTDKEKDIVLLNSDAVVTKGFLGEMQKILYGQEDIGAVCPRSNAATIFSVPVNNNSYNMEDSYQLYKKMRSTIPPYYIAPIAHGFCLMIRRQVVEENGLFDEIYGKGYGEENDFCLRIRKKGWKCAVANRAYVFHYKARSFSEDTRTVLVEKNEKILHQRFPEFTQLVRDYVYDVVEPYEKEYQ